MTLDELLAAVDTIENILQDDLDEANYQGDDERAKRIKRALDERNQMKFPRANEQDQKIR